MGIKKGEKLLCPKEVAEILGVSVGTLANWRVEKNFKFPYVKIGGCIRYKIDDVAEMVDKMRKVK